MNTKRKPRFYGLVLATMCAFVFALKILLPSNRLDDKEYQRRLARIFPGNSHELLNDATQITIYSLLSLPNSEIVDASKIQGKFHDYDILGHTSVNPNDNARVIAEISDGIADKKAFVAACFYPHHGVRIISGSQVLDLVVCFQCTTVVAYSGKLRGGGPIGRVPEKYLNQLLTAAGVPFAPNYKP